MGALPRADITTDVSECLRRVYPGCRLARAAGVAAGPKKTPASDETQALRSGSAPVLLS
jgi:hypothetical protein